VQPFYRRKGGGGAGRGIMEGGTAGIRPRQGRGIAGASWLSRRESTATRLVRVGRGGIRGVANRWQQARSVAGRGPFRVAPWRGSLAQGCPATWRCFSAVRGKVGEGREERGRESEGCYTCASSPCWIHQPGQMRNF
jgi:hypothetical protein